MSQDVADEGMPIQAPNLVKLTDWKIEPQLAALKLDVENARIHQKSHIGKVNRWLDNLRLSGTAVFKPAKGRSGVQPALIRKHAEWRYTDLSEPFLSSDKLFTVNPRTWEDKKSAEQNELLLNYQFDTAIDKVALVDHFVRTAVDEGAVILRTGWERETVMEEVDAPVYGYFPLQDPQAVQALQQMIQMVTDDPSQLEQLQPEVAEAVRYSVEKGLPFRAIKLRTEKVSQEKVIKNQPVVEIADIFNLVVDPTCGIDYDKAMFIAYSMEMSAGDLRKDKRYKNLGKVDWGRSPLSEPDHVRPTATNTDDFNFADKSRKKVVITEYWGRMDIDGTGRLQPIVVAWIGDVMIRCELNPYPDGKPPFVIVPLLPLRKSIYGEPDGALLEDNQKIIGAVTRGMIDIMARAANAQRGMAKNMLDVVNQRRFDAGQDYQFNPNVHPSNGIIQHQFPEIPNSAPNMISMQSMEAESLTGIKTFGNEGLTGASLGPTAAGTRGVLSATSRRTNGILRRMAKGMAKVGLKVVAMNQVFLSEEEVVRVTNDKFIKVRRDDLAGSINLKVDISSAEEDESKAQQLAFMLQTTAPNGDAELTKMMLAELFKLQRMPDLAHKVATYQPQPDPMAQRKLEAEIRKLEAEAMDLEASAKERMAKAEKALADARLAGSDADKKDLEFVEQETGTTHARRVDEIGAQARANTNNDITDAILNQRNSKTPDGKVDTSPTPENIREALEFNAGGQPA